MGKKNSRARSKSPAPKKKGSTRQRKSTSGGPSKPPPELLPNDDIFALRDGQWVHAKVVDAKPEENALFTYDHKKAKRKAHISSRRKSKATFDWCSNGLPTRSWALAKYDDESEEWLLFTEKGPICLIDKQDEFSHCICLRHYDINDDESKEQPTVKSDGSNENGASNVAQENDEKDTDAGDGDGDLEDAENGGSASSSSEDEDSLPLSELKARRKLKRKRSGESETESRASGANKKKRSDVASIASSSKGAEESKYTRRSRRSKAPPPIPDKKEESEQHSEQSEEKSDETAASEQPEPNVRTRSSRRSQILPNATASVVQREGESGRTTRSKSISRTSPQPSIQTMEKSLRRSSRRLSQEVPAIVSEPSQPLSNPKASPGSPKQVTEGGDDIREVTSSGEKDAHDSTTGEEQVPTTSMVADSSEDQSIEKEKKKKHDGESSSVVPETNGLEVEAPMKTKDAPEMEVDQEKSNTTTVTDVPPMEQPRESLLDDVKKNELGNKVYGQSSSDTNKAEDEDTFNQQAVMTEPSTHNNRENTENRPDHPNQQIVFDDSSGRISDKASTTPPTGAPLVAEVPESQNDTQKDMNKDEVHQEVVDSAVSKENSQGSQGLVGVQLEQAKEFAEQMGSEKTLVSSGSNSVHDTELKNAVLSDKTEVSPLEQEQRRDEVLETSSKKDQFHEEEKFPEKKVEERAFEPKEVKVEMHPEIEDGAPLVEKKKKESPIDSIPEEKEEEETRGAEKDGQRAKEEVKISAGKAVKEEGKKVIEEEEKATASEGIENKEDSQTTKTEQTKDHRPEAGTKMLDTVPKSQDETSTMDESGKPIEKVVERIGTLDGPQEKESPTQIHSKSQEQDDEKKTESNSRTQDQGSNRDTAKKKKIPGERSLGGEKEKSDETKSQSKTKVLEASSSGGGNTLVDPSKPVQGGKVDGKPPSLATKTAIGSTNPRDPKPKSNDKEGDEGEAVGDGEDPGIDLENFFPEKIVALQEALQIPMAQLFREANLRGGQMNAAYGWVRRSHLHRPAMQQAGRILARWYRDNLHRAPEGFEEPAHPPEIVEKPVSKSKNKSSSDSTTSSRRDSMADFTSDFPDCVRPNSDSGKYEIFLSMTHDTKPVVVVDYETSDEAVRNVARVKEMCQQQLALLQKAKKSSEKEGKRRRQRSLNCNLCDDKRESLETYECATCVKRYHMTCLSSKLSEMGFNRVDDVSIDFSCPNCLRAIFDKTRMQLGFPPEFSIGEDGSNGGRRSLRRRQSEFVNGIPGDALSSLLSVSPYGHVGDQGPQFAFSFPISASFIKGSGNSRPRSKTMRRKDGVDHSTNSQWVGEGYIDGGIRSRSRVYYPSFRFLDTPAEEYAVLDHVLLFRLSPDGEEEDVDDEEDEVDKMDVEEEATSTAANELNATEDEESKVQSSGKNKESPEFYVGQIEALWEEPDGARKARIAWFFWPSETQLDESIKTESDEVFSSNEVDVVALSSIAAKIKVVPFDKYTQLKASGQDLSTVMEAEAVENAARSGREDEKEEDYEIDDGEMKDASEDSPKGAPKDRHSHRQSSVHQRTLGEEEEKKLEVGTILRNKNREKVNEARRLLFSRRHYHYRASQLVGEGHPSFETGDGLNPWMHSFLHAKRRNPDSSLLLSEEDRKGAQTCDYTLGIADSVDNPDLDDMYKIESLDALLEMAPKCAFCFERLPVSGYVECATCTGAKICFECFSIGRQGVVKVSCQNDPTVTGTGTASDAVPVCLLHRSNHAYKVAKPKLDYSNPGLAIQLLEWMCRTHGLSKPAFELVGIVRGPLPSRETRGPSTRFRFAATFEYGALRMKMRHSKSGQIAHIIGSRYGKTVEEAMGICAVDSLCAVFGVTNKLNVPVLSSEWKAREALRLVDSLGIHSLAWEPAEEVVGNKSALACSEFFSCYLHPAWASENDWAQELRRLVESKDATLVERARYISEVPMPSATAVTKATKDAIDWGKKVHEMALRRSKMSRRTNRGLSFAVVDGQTVFATRPDSFGPRVTPSTGSILKMNLDTSSLPPEHMFLLREDLTAPSQLGSACTICKKNERADKVLLCDGCDSEYHIYCLEPPLKTVPESDWFCKDCMRDREYLYDHCSWGEGGGTLVRLVGEVGVTTAKGEVGDTLEKRVLEWKDNDAVIQDASAVAISMGFGAASTPTSRSPSRAGPKVSTVDQKKEKSKDKESSSSIAGSSKDEIDRKKRSRARTSDIQYPEVKRVKDLNSNGISPSSRPAADDQSETAGAGSDPLLLSKGEVENQIAWATRHHASQTVATLEASNRGLASALAQVRAERDALLYLLRKRESEILKT